MEDSSKMLIMDTPERCVMWALAHGTHSYQVLTQYMWQPVRYCHHHSFADRKTVPTELNTNVL